MCFWENSVENNVLNIIYIIRGKIHIFRNIFGRKVYLGIFGGKRSRKLDWDFFRRKIKLGKMD